jgi:hypothetical protein
MMADPFKTDPRLARSVGVMDNVFAAGGRFLLTEARLLERRLFATVFLGQPGAHVIDVLRGYQNDDGGFGHALEPDKRCPASLPIDVETAFGAMAAAGAVDEVMITRACDFLAATAEQADANGAVPPAFDIIEQFPRAAHWTDWTYTPALNPTAGLAGLLYQLGIDHPWRAHATEYCWQQLVAGGPIGDAHTLSEVMIFLAHVPDRDRADRHAREIATQFADVAMFHLDPDADGYGLTPLHLAPEPGSRWRSLFADAQIDRHLDRLLKSQQDDGGWPISWDPPSQAAILEWRGILTLQALRTLTSYGRIKPGD